MLQESGLTCLLAYFSLGLSSGMHCFERPIMWDPSTWQNDLSLLLVCVREGPSAKWACNVSLTGANVSSAGPGFMRLQ